MASTWTKTDQRIRKLLDAIRTGKAGRIDYSKYRQDPCGYAAKVLKVDWWSKQQEIARALLTPPYRVLVKASHSVGKSYLAGGLVNWWFDTRDPGVCLTTAPTARQVRDVLWKEVRRQRGARGGFPGPKIPRLESSPYHWAFGFTATNATSFQGQHEAAVLIILDEAVGIDREIWEGADSMVQGVEYGIVAFCNPTQTGSEFYQRESRGGWHVVHIPCLEHPNIAAELAGVEPPFPSAVRLAWLNERLAEWCSPVMGDPAPTDIEFPPSSGTWLRPGPLAEARLLGRWPSAASGVWSDTLWASVENVGIEPAISLAPEIGLDVARFGDDNTEYHVRCGSVSLHHEAHNGWDSQAVIGRLRNLCVEYAAWANKRRPAQAQPIRPEDICCKVDDDGMGGRIIDHANGFRWVGVRASNGAYESDEYPNVRSELWFAAAELAKAGKISVARLPAATRMELKRQAVAPSYRLDSAGRRVVEEKQVTKKLLGRSPDSMDSFNLAYYEVGGTGSVEWVDKRERPGDGGWRERGRR